MVTKVFTVYDSKAEVYRFPFFMQSAGMAIRAMIDLVNDGKSEISRFPADFTLFEVGSYNDQNGLLVALSSPLNLGVAVTFKNSIDGGK